MEEQLQSPMKAVEDLRHTVWKKQKVMTIKDFSALTGISRYRISHWMMKLQLFRHVLSGKALNQYKHENHIESKANGVLILMPVDTVKRLAIHFNIYTKELVAKFGEYFKPRKELVPIVQQEVLPLAPIETPTISIRTPQNLEKIKSIKAKLSAADCMLDELVGYKRKEEEHKLYSRFIMELIFAISMDINNLNKDLGNA